VIERLEGSVTLYLDWKSSSFCLSRISGALRNVAWPRLGEHRSWQGKARKQRIHPCKLFPGRCHARSCFHAWRKGKNGPQLAVGVLGTRNTRIFGRYPLGTYPQRWRLFLSYSSYLLHAPSAVQPMVPCLRNSK